jgi:quinol monooxygenase YgiN
MVRRGGIMLTVIAKIRAKPEHRAEVERELRALVEPTRAESGCINYDLHVAEHDANVFLFYENWADRAALEAHAASPHMNAWREKQPGLLSHGVEISLYEMLTQAPWV